MHNSMVSVIRQHDHHLVIPARIGAAVVVVGGGGVVAGGVVVVVVVVVVSAGAHFSPLAQYPLQHWLLVSQPVPLRWHGGFLAKVVPMPARPRILAMVVAAMVLRAWRREVAVAKALVKSSKREGSISFLPSFLDASTSRMVER